MIEYLKYVGMGFAFIFVIGLIIELLQRYCERVFLLLLVLSLLTVISPVFYLLGALVEHFLFK